MKKIYESESVRPNSIGRPLGRWKDRIKEYKCGRGDNIVGGLDQARKESLNRERWRLFNLLWRILVTHDSNLLSFDEVICCDVLLASESKFSALVS